MASRQSRLEAERLAIIQKSISRGRSKSPNRSRSTSPEQDKLKWSIMKHDPLERLDKAGTNDDVNDEPSEEENISDDDDNEKFHYDDTGNILPNYACHDEKINEILEILENSNLNDNSTIKKLEQLTASERAFANAKTAGKSIDASLLKKLQDEKSTLPSLFLNNDLDLLKSEQDVEARKQKLEDYASYRKKIIDQENEKFKEKHNHSHIQGSGQGQGLGQNQNQPSSGSNTNQNSDTNAEHDEFNIPYTSAIEDKLDSEFASHLNETIIESEVDSNKSQSRIIQTITRGNFFQLIDPKIKPKMFLLCMDFSPESIFALEWALGTVLVDGAVLFIIYVIEENDSNHNIKANTATESTREQHRLNMLNKAKQQVLNLIKLTKLQIHIVIEIIHHPIPRHLILEIIDNLQPTLVIVGSKGQSAIKGVLLGSLSNYLVTKLSVPVMVVREKLKKINRFKNGSSVFSNNIKPLTLSEARID